MASVTDVETFTAAVAFIDILGLRSLLQTRPLSDLMRTIMSAFAESIEPSLGVVPLGDESPSDLCASDLHALGFREIPGPHWILVSDSVLAFFPASRADTPDAAIFNATLFTQRAICRCSQDEIWLRGAVALGEVCTSRHTSGLLLLSRALVEAYEWEGAQNWIGGMLAPSAISALEHAANKSRISLDATDFFGARGLCVDYPIPLKTQLPSGCRSAAINLRGAWTLRDHAGCFVPPMWESVIQMRPEVGQKIANTLAFYDSLSEAPGIQTKPC